MRVLVDEYPERPSDCIFAKWNCEYGHICQFSKRRCCVESCSCSYLKAENPSRKCLSTDPKPLWLPDGFALVEEDTGDIYVFDEKEKMWIKMFNAWS